MESLELICDTTVEPFVEFLFTEPVILRAVALYAKRSTDAAHLGAVPEALAVYQAAEQAAAVGIAAAGRVYCLLRFNRRDFELLILSRNQRTQFPLSNDYVP